MNNKALKINFDDGSENIEINGDPNKVIKWYPTDINFVDRYLAFINWADIEFLPIIEKMKDKLENTDDYKIGEISEIGEEFNKQLDKVFGEGTSKIVFGEINPISPVRNGALLFQNFINALDPLIQDSINSFDSNSKKYIDQSNKLKKVVKK